MTLKILIRPNFLLLNLVDRIYFGLYGWNNFLVNKYFKISLLTHVFRVINEIEIVKCRENLDVNKEQRLVQVRRWWLEAVANRCRVCGKNVNRVELLDAPVQALFQLECVRVSVDVEGLRMVEWKDVVVDDEEYSLVQGVADE